jgi:DNA-binding transcriptional regulator GbsR (MarR family)
MYDGTIMMTSDFRTAYIDRNLMNHPSVISTVPTIDLSPLGQRFILHWGEMGSRWGVNRTVAQIHALLYFVGRPLHAEEISIALDVARSNVSNSLRELQSWKLVRVVHLRDDRRDHFETSRDVWDLFRTIVAERKTREFDPTMVVLRECIADKSFAKEDEGAQRRIEETLALMESLSAWGEEMLRLDPKTLVKVMKLGARIQMLVRGGKAKDDAKAQKKA